MYENTRIINKYYAHNLSVFLPLQYLQMQYKYNKKSLSFMKNTAMLSAALQQIMMTKICCGVLITTTTFIPQTCSGLFNFQLFMFILSCSASCNKS